MTTAVRTSRVLFPSPDDYRLILEAIPHIVWVASPEGRTEFFNQKGIEFTGLAPEATNGVGWVKAIHPDDAARARQAWQDAVDHGMPMAVDYRVRRHDGEFRWVSSLAAPVRGSDGSLLRWVGTWTDIEEQKRLHAELREAATLSAASRALLDAIQATAAIGFGSVDNEFRLQSINDTLAQLNGIDPATAIGRPGEEVLPAQWPRLEEIFRRVRDTGETIFDAELTKVTPSGEVRQWLATYYAVRVDEATVGVGFVGLDVTSTKQSEALRAAVTAHMAEGLYAMDRDGQLTFMNEAACRMLGWSEAELLGREMHEVVHFQHADGRPFAEVDCPLLKVRMDGRAIRVADDAFTRKDGSIFAAAYSAAPLHVGGEVEGVVVVFRDTSEEKGELQRMRRELAALSWVGRVREALDEGRMVLFAQPIVPLRGGEPSEELLIRMVGRSGELIQPGAFLPTAERYGMITEIDHWVVKQAMRLGADGRRVEVNLSAESIINGETLPLIAEQLRITGADPSRIVFELTETALMRDLEAGKSFALGLAEIGCPLALDDFGTGFGSFTYLKVLPVEFLKIDIEFVRDLTSNIANQHVVKAIVSLAQGFGQRTIAEGVEDADTLALLREFGVDFAQGFFLGMPAPL